MNDATFDISMLKTPAYVVDIELLRSNLTILQFVQDRTGCKILLALKAFSMWSVFDLCSQYLKGASASSLHEAKLIKEYFKGEVHFCAPGIIPSEADELIEICDHIVFNSANQLALYREKCIAEKVEIGLRINPEHSEVSHEIYDPCSKGSRLGMPLTHLKAIESLDGVSGLHFHTLCELGSDALERTLRVVEVKFGDYLHRMKWINFGGGHHITRPGYDIDLLCRLIEEFRAKYNVEVYLEPGEAIALNTGFLVASVLDVVERDFPVAILDTSAAAHMPDVLEMPYRPEVTGAGKPGEKEYTYRFAGPSCLSGDVIGEYSFDEPLSIGDKIIFHDMAHYSMVKNNMFNGINLPDIVIYNGQELKVQRSFIYEDFKGRLS